MQIKLAPFVAGQISIPPKAGFFKLLLIMNFTAFFLLALGLQVSANAYTQSITLSESNVPLVKVFSAIKKQSGYTFAFTESMLAKGKSVTIHVSNEKLEKVLELCFKEQPFTYEIIDKTVVVKAKPAPQKVTRTVTAALPLIDITGKVFTENGEPVAAAIEVKGTNQGTTTNTSGYFELKNVEEQAILVVSGVNIETFEWKVNGKTELLLYAKVKVGMVDTVTVQVNTGYQQLAKERATGSFAVIDNKLYNEQAGFSVLDRIKIITPGVMPFPQRVGGGPSSDIVIRGLSTLTMTIQKPLIILDNFEFQGDINNINPNDVENITILKDAAAGSIWGARAANGVIVITTKKAKFNQKTSVSFNANITTGERPDLFAISEISSNDLVDLEQFLFSQQYRFADTTDPIRRVYSPAYEILFRERNGAITHEQAMAELDVLRNHDVRNDFNDLFYRRPFSQQYALGVNGGSANMAWRLSFGFDKNTSELSATSDRYTIGFTNSYRPIDKLSLSVAINYSQQQTGSGAPGFGIINVGGGLPVYTRLQDESGNPLPLYDRYRKTYIDTLGGGHLLDWRYYPAENYKHERTGQQIQNLNTSLSADYKLHKFVSLQLGYRFQKQTTNLKTLYDEQSYFARGLINNFTQIRGGGLPLLYRVPRGGILDQGVSFMTAQNARAQVAFNRNIADHDVSVLAGMEISEMKEQGNRDRTYGYLDDILTFVNVDYATPFPLMTEGSSFIPNAKDFSSTRTRFVSAFANASYTFRRKYTVSLSGRRDASNAFGVATNDRWKPLWSTGLMWDISKEPFYRSAMFPSLKLRATYGYQGNLDISKVAVVTLRYGYTSPQTGAPNATIANFPNPDLQWEQTAMFNLALDFSTKNNRLSGSIEFFHKHITDLYGMSPVDPTTGTLQPEIQRNMGTAKGHGFDFVLNSQNIKGVFNWSSRLLVNTYRMKVLHYREVPVLGGTAIGGTFTPLDGYSPYSLFAYRWGGLDPETGDPIGYLNGAPTKDYAAIMYESTFSDLDYLGSSIPTISGSLGNTVSWKGFSAAFNISYALGYNFLRSSVDYSALIGQWRGHGDYALRWQKKGDEQFTQVPSFVYPANNSRDYFYRASAALVEPGDHIRLNYINLSYTFDQPRFKRSFLAGCQLYTVVNNLGILWRANKYGLDPAFGDRTVPPIRTILVGIRTGI